MINDSFPQQPNKKGTEIIENFSGNRIITLDELFSGIDTKGIPLLKFDNPEDLSNQRGFGLAYDRDFMNLLYESYFNLELQQAFERFRNEIVVDLGAGSSGYGLRLAEVSGARAVVMVEPFFSHLLLKNIQNPTDAKPYPNTTRIPVVIAPEDALNFLKRLPDNSVSILAGGIDRVIIEDPKYRKLLGWEVARVLSSTGAFINYHSDLITPGLVELSPSGLPDLFVYKKK